MNILTSQIQQQKPEVLEMVCQIHQLEIIALDLDTSEKGQFQYLCCYCLVDKMNNNKISTIEQTKDRISSLKTQKKENKTKEIQKRLDYFKNILDQIMDFKNTVENTLEKLYSQIKAQIHTVQQEKQLLLEGVQVQQNFQDDVKSLSQFLSSEYQGKQIEFQQDSQFIDEIFKQFELLFNNASYFQTIDAFKDAKQKINEINENFQIELMPQQNKNNYKTPSLNKICPMHNKEIIMIDMDTKKKKVDDRFACVDCISDHPHCQYRTIEKVNQEWNSQKQQQDRVLNDLKLKRKEKQAKLNQQVALIRKNYNQQINEISEKIITEFSTPINQTNDICKFKQTSLQGLTNEELVSNINYLIEYDKENQFQDSKIVYAKSKDLLFVKEIENKLEHLKQHNQLDIQESLNILKEDNRIQGINLLFQQILESTKGNQEQLILKQDLEELLNSSKQIYCQQGLFNQTIHKFQEHLIKINNINNKMKQIPDHINLTFFQKCVQDYTDKFQNDFHQLKKFCDIENLENKLNALQIDYKKLEQESKKMIDDQNNKIDQLKEFEKGIQLELKKSNEEKQLLNKKLIEQQNNYVQQIKEEQLKNQYQIQELNNNISQKVIQISQVKKELDYRIQMFEPISKLYMIHFYFAILILIYLICFFEIKDIFKILDELYFNPQLMLLDTPHFFS